MNATEPIGKARCHHMPEAYYEKWDKLQVRCKSAYRKACKTGKAKDCDAWLRAHRKLVEHENNHNTT